MGNAKGACQEDANEYDNVIITSTSDGDDQEYVDVRLPTNRIQPASIELTPCPAYLTVKSTASSSAENNLVEAEYEMI